MEASKINNYRQVKVKFISPTNTRGARIVIYEPSRYNDQPTQKKYFSFDYRIGDIMEQAYKILCENGFNVVARASERENYIFLCDNWGEDYIEINTIK